MPIRLLRTAREWLFRIDGDEVTFSRRGFYSGCESSRIHLEQVGQSFLAGYHAAIRADDLDRLSELLAETEDEFRGFAFEGAAMAIALLDQLSPVQRNRWQKFLAGSGAIHRYMLHVGYGWAIARLPWLRGNICRRLSRFDSTLRWLVLDGYGFHEGYFNWRRFVYECRIPTNLSGYALRAFDQGLGRSLWFVGGADVARITGTIGSFPPTRHSDLWSGVGLACAYAGGADYSMVTALRESAQHYRGQVAQGAAFAAKAREHAGNPTDHTNMACELLCGMSAGTAAATTDACLNGLSRTHDNDKPDYECWRQRIQSRMDEALQSVA